MLINWPWLGSFICPFGSQSLSLSLESMHRLGMNRGQRTKQPVLLLNQLWGEAKCFRSQRQERESFFVRDQWTLELWSWEPGRPEFKSQLCYFPGSHVTTLSPTPLTFKVEITMTRWSGCAGDKMRESRVRALCLCYWAPWFYFLEIKGLPRRQASDGVLSSACVASGQP